MTEEQVLAKLHDIVSAKPLGLWPLAIGWYFVGFILLSLLILAVLWSYKWARHGKPKRAALSLLQDCQSTYVKDGNPIAAAISISELLRRVALAYYPAVDVASLQGSAWIDFLTKQSPAFKDLETCLTELPYQKTSSASDDKIQKLFSESAAWIKQRDKPCSN